MHLVGLGDGSADPQAVPGRRLRRRVGVRRSSPDCHHGVRLDWENRATEPFFSDRMRVPYPAPTIRAVQVPPGNPRGYAGFLLSRSGAACSGRPFSGSLVSIVSLTRRPHRPVPARVHVVLLRGRPAFPRPRGFGAGPGQGDARFARPHEHRPPCPPRAVLGGLADNRLSRYSAPMSDFVRAITTGTKATAISIMGITTIPLTAGPGVRR